MLLKDLCTIKSSKRIFEHEYVSNGIPFVRGQEISDKSIFKEDNKFECYISKERYNEIKLKYGIPKIGDILITAVGTIGNLCYIDRNFDFYYKDGNLIQFTNFDSRLNSKFLYYFMQSPLFKKQLEYSLIGAVQKALTMDMLGKIEINLPDRKIQDKIVEILSNIDNQIKRNNCMVKRLQDLATSTYSRWFNQFEFPNEDGLSYKSNDGEFVYNEELKRNIPVGWEVKKLGDLLVKNSKRYNGKSIETIDLSVMPSNSFSLMNLNNSDNFTTNLFEMQKGDILFGSIRPYLKKAGIAPCNGAYAGTVYSYKPINIDDYNVCLSALTSEQIFSFAMKNAKGTKMPVIANDDLMKYKIPYNKSIAKLFNNTFNIKDIVCNCVMQNIELNNLKSKLLPLLINGQLEV